jgi:hypothetical protein
MDLYGFIWSYMGLMTVFKCVLLKWIKHGHFSGDPPPLMIEIATKKNLDGTWDWFCLRSTWRKKNWLNRLSMGWIC